MMKLIKKYFLYVADAPIWKGVLTGTILFIVLMSAIIIFFGTGWRALNLGCVAMDIVSYFTLFLSTINFIVVKLWITAFKHLDKKIIVIYNDEKIEKYQRPFWGKPHYAIINLPKNWKLPLTKRVHSTEIETRIRINKLFAHLKFQVFFSFTGELNENELNNLVKSQINYRLSKQVSFVKCIKTIFEGHNLVEKNFAAVEIIISDWLDSKNERTDLIEKINGVIEFPNDSFDNMKIEVLLEKVDIQLACVFY